MVVPVLASESITTSCLSGSVAPWDAGGLYGLFKYIVSTQNGSYGSEAIFFFILGYGHTARKTSLTGVRTHNSLASPNKTSGLACSGLVWSGLSWFGVFLLGPVWSGLSGSVAPVGSDGLS